MTNPTQPMPAGVEVDGDAIRRHRQNRGLTVSQFASLVEVTPSYISQLERGNRRLSPPVFVRMLNALDLSDRPDELRAA